MNYYTMQIHYGGTNKPQVEELKDLHSEIETADAERQWLRAVREKIYTTGFQVRTSPTTLEFISPLRIHTVYMIRQDKKFEP
jgi:hypothetical protein